MMKLQFAMRAGVAAVLVGMLVCGSPLFAADGKVFDVGTLTITVSSGTMDWTDAEITALNTDKWTNGEALTNIVKKGLGTFSSRDLLSFHGDIHIDEGYWRHYDNEGLGTPSTKNGHSGVVYVKSGATLEIKAGCSTYSFTKPKTIYIEGTGVAADGSDGAIKGTSGSNIYLGNVVLLGDAKIVSGAPLNFKYNSTNGGNLTMNGHTLTVHDTATNPDVSFAGKVLSPGNFIVTAGSVRFVQEQTDGSAHTITLNGSGYVGVYNYRQDTDWTVNVDSPRVASASLFQGATSPSGSGAIRWTGDVNLNTATTNEIAGGGAVYTDPLLVKGTIGGIGSLNYSGSGYRYVSGPNTYSGETLFTSGYNFMETTTAIPDMAKVRFPGTSVYVGFCAKSETNPSGFTGEQVAALAPTLRTAAGFDFTLMFGRSWADASDVVDFGTVTLDGTKKYPLLGAGGGVTAVIHPNLINQPVFQCGCDYATGNVFRLVGPLVDNDPSKPMLGNNVKAWSGTLEFHDVGRLTLSNLVIEGTQNLTGTRASGKMARMVFSGNTSASTFLQPNWRTTSGTSMAGNQDSHGILEVTDGAVLTNRLYNISVGQDSCATVRISGGGFFRSISGGGNDCNFGSGTRAQAYLEIDNGTFIDRGCFHFATARSATGMMVLKSGSATFEDGIEVGREGTGVVYQCGGVIVMPATAANRKVWIPSAYYRDPASTSMGRAGHGEVTVDGADSVMIVSNNVHFCDRDYANGHLNIIDGGTVSAYQIRKALVQSVSGSGTAAYLHAIGNETTKGYLGFNGGTVRAGKSGMNLFGSPEEPYQYHAELGGAKINATGDSRPDRITIYAGGATIDTAGFTVTNTAPLQAPTGNGIARIDLMLPEGETALEDYMAAPRVIINGDGAGATAVALFDYESGKVTGVKVTSPGWGYTTATAKLMMGGSSFSKAGTNLVVTLGADAGTGGLTKKGEGTLVLTAANTYGGATRIEGGALKPTVAGAIPAGSEVILAGGTFDASANAALAPATVTVDAEAYLQSSAGMRKWTLMTFAPGEAPAVMPNVLGLDSGLIACKDGDFLCLRRVKGMMISVR